MAFFAKCTSIVMYLFKRTILLYHLQSQAFSVLIVTNTVVRTHTELRTSDIKGCSNSFSSQGSKSMNGVFIACMLQRSVMTS